MKTKMTLAQALVVLLVLGVGQADYPPATPCDSAHCLLPACYCSTTNVPSGLAPADIPQIVMLSFDDALDTQVYYPFYEPLFDYKNPDGCNIGITYFLSHDYTDYTLVNAVYNRGHEIASESITLQTPTSYWETLDYQGTINEMFGLKQIASNLANIPMDAMVGARAPFLQLNGDTTFSALDDSGFLYDSTRPSLTYENNPLFPYSYDYKSVQDCPIPPCPTDSYPDFWEVPLNDYNSSSGTPCDMLDSCPSTNTTQNTFNLLLHNFNVHYQGNRAPFGVFTHASWFETDPSHYPGYVQFIEYLLHNLTDVYIKTVTQAIQWVQQPTTLANLASFEPWACQSFDAPCPGFSCYYSKSTPGGERYMESCIPCPDNYPWLNDPYGNATLK